MMQLIPARLLSQVLNDSTEVEDSLFIENEESEIIVDTLEKYEIPSPPDGFLFDSIYAPCLQLYSRWDTLVIDPYGENLLKLTEIFSLSLIDSFDCFYYPPCLNTITSGFGYREWGRRYRKFHYGTDFRLNTGDPVYAAFDGVVRIAKFSTSYGFVVVIRHYNGLETLYGHFSKLLVYTGQAVRAGEVIGLGGNTGWSTGSHLHFEIRFKGKPLDPGLFINFEGRQLKSDNIALGSEAYVHLYLPPALKLNGKKWRHFAYKTPKKRYHKVRKGDTVYKIANRYRTTATKICKLNRISPKQKLKSGRILRVT